MGWKGTIRSVGAAVRRAEREAARRERERERHDKHLARLDAAERAACEVEDYESDLAKLLSLHRDEPELVDWESIIENPPGTEPASTNAGRAMDDLAGYKPSIVDRVLRRVDRKTDALGECDPKGQGTGSAGALGRC